MEIRPPKHATHYMLRRRDRGCARPVIMTDEAGQPREWPVSVPLGTAAAEYAAEGCVFEAVWVERRGHQ